MIVEIRKAGFVNKGAELMLYAALRKMKEAYPDAIFAMSPNFISTPFDKRMELGLYQKAPVWKKSNVLDTIFSLVPKKIRDMYGIVVDTELDMVLDAAGFSYSDQFDCIRTQELASTCKRLKKNGTKIVLLPQAFGPFTEPKIRKAIKTAIDNVDLVFAREKVSYDYLVDVVGERPNLKLAPDFTNLIEGILPDDFDATNNRFCVVPNYRMIDKSPKAQSEAYLPFMITCTRYLVEKGAKPFILVHEGANDLMLAEKINDALGGVLQIIKETHPLKIKGILGACDATLGSRFHGLASALSQGVPSLATGWSHKYSMLLSDYDFTEGLLQLTDSKEDVYAKLDMLINEDSRRVIIQLLTNKSNLLKKQSEMMWDSVFTLLD